MKEFDEEKKNPDGTTTHIMVLGDTAPAIQTGYFYKDGVKQEGETILTEATITIDNRVTRAGLPEVVAHEAEHAGEARSDPKKFTEDQKKEASMPHDQRPQEQRANDFANKYKKQIADDAKRRKKERELQRKKDKKKKKQQNCTEDGCAAPPS